jgi:hypothetical protein
MSDNDLEKEFKDLNDTIGKEIDNKINEASKLLREAVELANKHGLPFYAYVSELGQPYVPESFEEKWSDLNKEDVEELTGVSSYDLESAYGWKHSDVC